MKGLLVAVPLLLGSSILISEAAADDVADIAEAAEKALDAYNNGDVDAIFKYVVAGSRVFGGNGRPATTVGKEGMEAAFAAGWKYDLQWRDFQTQVHGESAVSTAFLDGTITRPDSSVVQGPWRASNAWIKEGGKWKTVHYHVSQLLPDVRGAEALVARYHKAIEEKDNEVARACLGDTYVRAGRTLQGLPGDPARWGGGVMDTEEFLGAVGWTDPGTTYANTIQFLHTAVDETSGIVVTRETGSMSSPEGQGSWEGVTNLWFVAKVDGAWKIAGSLHHIQD